MHLLLVGVGGFIGSVLRYLTTGLLGGFTTFSAFGQEAITLLRVDPMKGTFFSVVPVVLGIAAVAVGRAIYGLAFRS
jgi:fluoride exporter